MSSIWFDWLFKIVNIDILSIDIIIIIIIFNIFLLWNNMVP